jgi:outer membrane protein TolC
VTGAEWNLSYGQVRSNDKSVSRKFVTAYEPAMIFELKQPLLRDAWPDVNLAGVNISKLNYRIALAAFRQKAEAVSSEVISLYWTLIRARRNVEIQQALLEKTEETLRKVTDRKNIDATVGDIKQVEAAAKTREANLFEAEREVGDVQDRLVRLLSDHQITVIDDLEIIPVTAMDIDSAELDRSELLKLALKNNPEIRQAELETDVEEINVKVAKKQKMPRIDVVASAELYGLSDDRGDAHEMIYDRDHNSYTVGLNFEYPLGNRERNAEFRRRKLEHARARSNLHNITDRVAILVKERARLAETAFKQILVQKEAVSAAEIHLQALEYYESIIKKLTPEFLLTKIQAQNTLANTKRATMKAIADYNIALTRLAQATGTVLDLRSISPAAQQLIISELKQ